MDFTQKIIWISDLHQTVSGQVEGVKCSDRLQQLIEQVNRWHSDAACCVASGDLTDTGTPEEYEALLEALAALDIPFLPMIGNHDHRETMMRSVPRPGQAMDQYFQYRYDVGELTLLCLDTNLPGSDAGAFDDARLNWLSDTLTACKDRRVIAFTHHPPGPLGLGPLDEMALLEHERFIEILADAPQVEHLFCGHVHRPVSGVIGGVPFTTLRALAHQTLPPYREWDWETFVARDERPQYGVILAGKNRLVVQMNDLEDPA